MGVVISAVACYWIVRLTVMYVATREQIAIAKRAAERAAIKSALERNGYTVVVNPLNGDITHYFKGGESAARRDDSVVVG